MTTLRHSTILALISFCLLGLLGSSFATCLVTAESECCETEHECDDPVCPDGAICHCACAYSGVLTAVEFHDLIPTVAGELNAEPVIAFVPQLSSDLFRPPRIV